MPFITVGKENSGDIQLYYEDHGAGRPVVLIHGWPLSGASWEKQLPALLDAGYRVITYDRRGFGRSDRPVDGYTYDVLAADLDAIMTTLDLRDAMLFGFSMGGGEVARYLANYGSERVRAAGFIAAIPPFLLKTGDNQEGVDKSVFDGIQQGIAADRPAFLAQFFENFYNADVRRGTRVSDELLRLSWNIASEASYHATWSCVSAWLEDFRDDLKTVSVPVLVVHGDTDRIVPIEVSGTRTHEMMPGSTLVTIAGGSHGLNWTHADELNAAMLEFLGR